MIGADPELFLHDGNQFISAVGRIGGSKMAPKKLLGGFCLQEDNVTVEYNIPPAKSVVSFVDYNMLMLEHISELAKEQELKIKLASSAEFSDKELDSEGARTFGCDPDFNAWTLNPNPRPHSENPRLRSAGGHIHIGCDLNTRDKIKLIRVLDMLLMPLAFLDPESKRRELYGLAGACRIKPYGVEYRTPSNIWLSSEDLMITTANICFEVKKASEEMYREYDIENQQVKIEKAINELDIISMSYFYPTFRNYWPKEILKKLPSIQADDEPIRIVRKP